MRTAVCERKHRTRGLWYDNHWACSGRVICGVLPWGRLGHWEPCDCDCHPRALSALSPNGKENG